MFNEPAAPSTIAVPDVCYVPPLLSGLESRRDLEIVSMTQPAVIEALRAGRCACALVPPDALLHINTISVLPGAGVVARGATPSERLETNAPLDAIRSIAVARDSAHLASYVRVLFAERGLPLPVFHHDDSPDASSADARLVSGAQPGDERTRAPGFDLGTLWMETTDLPMVLAVWACGPLAPYRMLRHVLGDAARQGEEALQAESAATAPGSPLRDAYYYRLLSLESDSIRRLLELARRHAISETTVESIVFC